MFTRNPFSERKPAPAVPVHVVGLDVTAEEIQQLQAMTLNQQLQFVARKMRRYQLERSARADGGELGYLLCTLSLAERHLLAFFSCVKYGIKDQAEQEAYRAAFLQAFEERAAERKPDRSLVHPTPAHLKDACPDCGYPMEYHE